MDIINECEWTVVSFGDIQLIVFDNLPYWGYTYDQVIKGGGHISFELNMN